MCIVCRAAEDVFNLSVEDVLAGLRSQVSRDKGMSKFNISRNHIWEGARRSFLRTSYSPEHEMSVKFTDDIGVSEGAVDQGGPRREFLQLVVKYLSADSPLFIGPESAKHLNPLHTGEDCLTCLLCEIITATFQKGANVTIQCETLVLKHKVLWLSSAMYSRLTQSALQ